MNCKRCNGVIPDDRKLFEYIKDMGKLFDLKVNEYCNHCLDNAYHGAVIAIDAKLEPK
jgi:hypothetical protein